MAARNNKTYKNWGHSKNSELCKSRSNTHDENILAAGFYEEARFRIVCKVLKQKRLAKMRNGTNDVGNWSETWIGRNVGTFKLQKPTEWWDHFNCGIRFQCLSQEETPKMRSSATREVSEQRGTKLLLKSTNLVLFEGCAKAMTENHRCFWEDLYAVQEVD